MDLPQGGRSLANPNIGPNGPRNNFFFIPPTDTKPVAPFMTSSNFNGRK